MGMSIDEALRVAELAYEAGDRDALIESWARLSGLLDLEARGADADRVLAMVLKLQEKL